MKEVEPTQLQLAKLKANQETMGSIRQRLQKMQRKIQMYAKKNQELAEEIRDQMDDPVDTPLEKWQFDQVDWVEYEGTIKIPEEDE